MRPEKLKYLLSLEFDKFFKTNEFKISKYLLRELKKEWSKLVKHEKDGRSGKETYGYSPETIENTLIYISDRFYCTFRLKWIIDGIEQNKF